MVKKKSNSSSKVREFKAPHPNGPKYFEGILQLRNPTEEVIEYVWSEMDNHADKHAYIQKAVDLKNGIDYYMTSNRFLKTLGKKLLERFGGELKSSAKLHTRDKQTSKDLYRLTVLFRLPEFTNGQTVEFKGEEYIVTGMGKKIFLKHAKSGKKVVISQSDIAKVKAV